MELKKIYDIASKLDIDEEYVIPYTLYKGKIDLEYYKKELSKREDGKLVLVTAITPTKAGEGKTTTSIALIDGLAKINQKAIGCLREPSLGPVFGLKGGACGGGKVTIEPSEDINLHFNGDFHALTSAINLINAIIDNSLYQGNPLNIDKDRILFPRSLDMNDRTLRNVRIGLGKGNGVERDAHFVITVANELMAVFCLAKDSEDFISRVNNISFAYSLDGKLLKIKELKISKAIYKLMKEALNPNLVQTREGNPVLVHGGPFANIAHGANSIIATKMGLKLAPIVVTEAGFGGDLGMEKFLDIVSQEGNFHPSTIVMVATIRALKVHGGQDEKDLATSNVEALKEGSKNLLAHLENVKLYGIPFVVAINHFETDSKEEIETLENILKEHNYPYSFLDGYLKGGEGSIDLAKKVVETLQTQEEHYHPIYDRHDDVYSKIETICKKIYHCKNVEYSSLAKEQIESYIKEGYQDAYICMAKTPQSFSDDPKLLNDPRDHTIHIREVNLSSGANFLVCLTGTVLTLPGLPKVPQAVKMEDE